MSPSTRPRRGGRLTCTGQCWTCRALEPIEKHPNARPPQTAGWYRLRSRRIACRADRPFGGGFRGRTRVGRGGVREEMSAGSIGVRVSEDDLQRPVEVLESQTLLCMRGFVWIEGVGDE